MNDAADKFWKGQTELKAELADIEAEYEAAKGKYWNNIQKAYKKAAAHDVETCPLRNGTGRCRGLYVCAQFTIFGGAECETFKKEYRRLTEKYPNALQEVSK